MTTGVMRHCMNQSMNVSGVRPQGFDGMIGPYQRLWVLRNFNRFALLASFLVLFGLSSKFEPRNGVCIGGTPETE
jgi:hypothetical protein